ncbi:hypothetical protein ACUNV4_25115 [Granulosicoccus sp. 3-233]|uniref:hypothetical protein n=1 Tax=Granulosicoccus sp. 3-233 TaxID=3417969 RepID=UPI003D33D0CC
MLTKFVNQQADEMKIDSVVPTDDLQQSHGDSDTVTPDHAGETVASDKGMSSHDLRASLAIVNGFSAALGASFQDLTDQYQEILESNDVALIAESADRLMMLDADCRFCLSRLHTSIDKLKERLERERLISGPGRAEDTNR